MSCDLVESTRQLPDRVRLDSRELQLSRPRIADGIDCYGRLARSLPIRAGGLAPLITGWPSGLSGHGLKGQP